MKWKPQAEEFLSVLLWGADKLTRPTLGNLLQSYEAWDYHQRLRHQLRRLHTADFVQCEGSPSNLIYKLTSTGRLAALGGRDPVERWSRRWDGRWRMIVFDLPARHQTVRKQLLRWLHENSFGYLQNSVWIHPDPVDDLTDALREFREDVESLTLLEANCCAGYTNEAIVRGAWNFDDINNGYRNHLLLLESAPLKTSATPAELLRYLREERRAWLDATLADPLLPRPLLPTDYLGETVWQQRTRTLPALARRLGL